MLELQGSKLGKASGKKKEERTGEETEECDERRCGVEGVFGVGQRGRVQCQRAHAHARARMGVRCLSRGRGYSRQSLVE